MKRPVDPIAAVIVEERNVVLAVAAEQRLPSSEHQDLVSETVTRTLAAHARGRVFLEGDDADKRAAVRAYLRIVARRIVYRRRVHESLEALTVEPADPSDLAAWCEARSTLRALDLSPTALAVFQLVAFTGSVPVAARRLGIPAGTLYTRLRALRADAHAALRRLK